MHIFKNIGNIKKKDAQLLNPKILIKLDAKTAKIKISSLPITNYLDLREGYIFNFPLFQGGDIFCENLTKKPLTIKF